MKTRTFFATTAVGLACGALVIAALPSASAQAPSSAVKRTIVVEDASVTLIDNVKVPAQEAGRLMKVHVIGGERVDGGFVLAEIDNRDTLAKQKIAEAEVNVARVQAQSEAELEVARFAVGVSQAELDQSKDIREKNPGAVSDTEHRKLIFQLQRAQAQVKVAESDLLAASETTKVKEAQLEATINELARRQITAPFAGEVNEVIRQVGEWVQPGEPIAHLVRFDRVRVKGMVYAKDAAPIDVIGKNVEIVVMTAGNKEETVRGKIDFASQVIDGTGSYRAFKVFADVDNKQQIDPITKRITWAIQPGSLARMEIDLSPPAPAKPVKAEPAKAPVKGGPAVPGTFRPRGALNTTNVGETIETLKPVTPEPARQPRIR